MLPRVIGPERRANGTHNPVRHDVGQLDVTREMLVDVSLAVAPAVEFL
jgi:hypothetical protein